MKTAVGLQVGQPQVDRIVKHPGGANSSPTFNQAQLDELVNGIDFDEELEWSDSLASDGASEKPDSYMHNGTRESPLPQFYNFPPSPSFQYDLFSPVGQTSPRRVAYPVAKRLSPTNFSLSSPRLRPTATALPSHPFLSMSNIGSHHNSSRVQSSRNLVTSASVSTKPEKEPSSDIEGDSSIEIIPATKKSAPFGKSKSPLKSVSPTRGTSRVWSKQSSPAKIRATLPKKENLAFPVKKAPSTGTVPIKTAPLPPPPPAGAKPPSAARTIRGKKQQAADADHQLRSTLKEFDFANWHAGPRLVFTSNAATVEKILGGMEG